MSKFYIVTVLDNDTIRKHMFAGDTFNYALLSTERDANISAETYATQLKRPVYVHEIKTVAMYPRDDG